MDIERLLNGRFQKLVEAEEQREAIVASERELRRERGLELLDASVEERRLAVIKTIGNDSLSEARKKSTSASLAEAIVNRVMYKMSTESVLGTRSAGMNIVEIARLRDVVGDRRAVSR